MTDRILVAGVGNIFLSDDGFGVEVAKRLQATELPPFVRVSDFGIRGIHLAYELMDSAYELTILVDATARQGAPGTVYLIEPDMNALDPEASADAHTMTPDVVLSMLKRLGGAPGRILVVGCEPQCLDEDIGLSPVVEAAVAEAIPLILEVIHKHAPAWVGAEERQPDCAVPK